MNSIHERLKQERVRLDLNQTKFAEIGGVQRRAQANYESGERCPDGHYYAAIAAAGADVLYILTGKRAVSEVMEVQADDVMRTNEDIPAEISQLLSLCDQLIKGQEKMERQVDEMGLRLNKLEQPGSG